MIKILTPIIIGAGAIMITAVIFALPTLLLWNWVMPDILGLPYIQFWQALGVNLLSGVLFRWDTLISPPKSKK